MDDDRLRLDLGHSYLDLLFDGDVILTAYTDRDGIRTTRSSTCLRLDLIRFAWAICRRFRNPLMTVITVRKGGKIFLATQDAAGNETVLAQFINEESARRFNEAMATAKASAHAAGASGI